MHRQCSFLLLNVWEYKALLHFFVKNRFFVCFNLDKCRYFERTSVALFQVFNHSIAYDSLLKK